ncbi:MAG: hypothetical protein H7177_09350 [Rhizobacter sp.]|nr:hypothetical protein [Bacteriovorax sp.]
MKITLIMVLMLSSFTLFSAENNFLTIIGGGGEPVDAVNTQFDTGITNLSAFYQANKNNYKTTVNFNGGHRETEALVADKYKDATIENGFNQDSYDKMIKEYLRKITANPPEIKEGDKIMIFINDHGGESKGDTHSISASASAMQSMNSGSHDGMISLDTLAQLTAAAEKAKVKLAIIDGTCHSGNSIPLSNSKTCVITASGPKHYGYSSFAETFANNMVKGKNLEDAFLETRAQLNGDGFPEISTPEGKLVQAELYPMLTPYMYYHDEYRGMALDKIDIYLKARAPAYETEMCMRQNEYIKLDKLITLIEDMTSIEKKALFSKKITMEKTIDLSELKKQLKSYHEVQEDYLKRLSSVRRPMLETKEPMKIGTDTMSPYTHKELLDGNWASYMADKNKDLEDTTLTEEKRKDLTYDRDFYAAAALAKEKILREHPEYAQYQNILDELKTNTKTSKTIASSIARGAQTAYDAYYKNTKKKLADGDKNYANPCKDFVL